MSFYVTAIDGPRVFLLAGPYEDKSAAEAAVEPVREIACDFSRNAEAGRAWFMSYGVSRWKQEGELPRSALGVYEP